MRALTWCAALFALVTCVMILVWSGQPEPKGRLSSSRLERLNNTETTTSEVPAKRTASKAEAAASQVGKPREAATIEARISEGPIGRRVEALPSITGFDVHLGNPTAPHPALILAAEPDNLAWSTPMEAQILQQLARTENMHVDLIHVECRSTICGIVLSGRGVVEALQRDRLDFELSDTLGFPAGSLMTRKKSDGTEYAAIYLQSKLSAD